MHTSNVNAVSVHLSVRKSYGHTNSILGVDAQYLITEVSFTKDSGGSKTQLTLMPPEAFVMMNESPDEAMAKKATKKAAAKTGSSRNYVKATVADAAWTGK